MTTWRAVIQKLGCPRRLHQRTPPTTGPAFLMPAAHGSEPPGIVYSESGDGGVDVDTDEEMDLDGTVS